MRPGRAQLVRSDDGYFFRVKGGNGTIVCHSQTYSRLSDTKKGVRATYRALLLGSKEYVDERTQAPA